MVGRMWALLVAIEDYIDPRWEDDQVSGASMDLHHVREYLQRDLAVASGHIISLHNAQATRRNILQAFQSHLIDNKDIHLGDALLFHFTGHGSRTRAPKNWPIVDDPNTPEEERGMLELILPADIEMVDPASGRPICGIPDRTLASLLARAAAAHGENITVVLDCCNSGHGTRGTSNPSSTPHSFSMRGIHPSRITPLQDGVDRDIYSSEAPLSDADVSAHAFRGGFTERRAKSHILMAACGKYDGSLGDQEGGLFTRCWLTALRRTDIQPRSYAELIKHIRADVLSRCERYGLPPQHPQCEGVTRNRIVFENTPLDPRRFEVSTMVERDTLCLVQAGEIHGVQMNTVFDIYLVEGQTTSVLGTAVAKAVFATYCEAELADGVHIFGRHTIALITQLAYSLKYAVVNNGKISPTIRRHRAVVDHGISQASSDGTFLVSRLDPAGADLVLEVGERGINFHRRDINLRDLGTPHPRIDSEDVESANMPHILNAIAHFNFYFTLANVNHPFAGQIDFHLYLLEDDPDLSYLDGSLDKALALKERVFVRNDEASIVECIGDNYAFVIHNNTTVPLFPYLIYFDPRTYEIQTWYAPFNVEQPPLLPHSTLQIGGSPEHAVPFNFFVSGDDDSELDVCFLKLFLLDHSPRLDFMEQDPVLGRDDKGRSYVRMANRGDGEEGVEVRPTRGVWDTITYQINIRR